MSFLDSVKLEIIDPPQKPDADGLPSVTHQGPLELAGFKCTVYQLSNGQRIIEEKDVIRFLEFMGMAADKS